jgi:hypothetical protein
MTRKAISILRPVYPFPSAAKSNTRFEMDLEPGTVTVPQMGKVEELRTSITYQKHRPDRKTQYTIKKGYTKTTTDPLDLYIYIYIHPNHTREQNEGFE